MSENGIPLDPVGLHELAQRHGGEVRNGQGGIAHRLAPIGQAGAGELAPLMGARYIGDAQAAVDRGALLLIDDTLGGRSEVASLPGWFHRHPAYALAEILGRADVPAPAPRLGPGCQIGANVVLMPRVTLGARVVIGAGAVIGEAGFGFALSAAGAVRATPHLGGVVIEDDVYIGALCTIAAGTLSPTIIRRGVKLDAHVHIAHNCHVGEATLIAAQTGLAGSVYVGRGVQIGGQVGVADHVRIGDGARIAAKSGVIGDVPAGVTVAGYPAVERHRWLRGLAQLYRLGGKERRSSRFPVVSEDPLPSSRRVTSVGCEPGSDPTSRLEWP